MRIFFHQNFTGIRTKFRRFQILHTRVHRYIFSPECKGQDKKRHFEKETHLERETHFEKETPFEKETLEKETFFHFEKETSCEKETPVKKSF